MKEQNKKESPADIIIKTLDEKLIKNGFPPTKPGPGKKGAFVTFSPKPKKNK